MHDLVRRLHDRHGAAMLLVTHDVAEAIALGDRILVMHQGRIGTSYRVELSADDRRSSQAREELRGRLLADLGLAGHR
jgi:sulfonate transport system ATP-binding protein